MTQMVLSQYIQSLTEAASIAEVHGICSDVCAYFGFDRFHYGAQLPTSFTKPCFIDVSGYPSEWWERYKTEGYLGLDPVVQYCATNFMPLSWDRIKPNKRDRDAGWRIMGEAGDFGLKCGISLPLHTAQGEAAMLSFASARDHEYVTQHWERTAPQAHFFMLYLHEAVRRLLADCCVVTQPAQLTERERECLLWAADGKTTWETSRILNISERTVIFHLQNVSEKLNVANRQQAVARAVALGLITPTFT